MEEMLRTLPYKVTFQLLLGSKKSWQLAAYFAQRYVNITVLGHTSANVTVFLNTKQLQNHSLPTPLPLPNNIIPYDKTLTFS